MPIRKKQFAITVIFTLTACTVFAHFSWIRLDTDKFETGAEAILRIAHGHYFPLGEHDLPISHTKAYVIKNNGEKNILTLSKRADSLSAKFTPVKPGLYRFCFVYNPVIMSKTTKGWKIGGIDLYPNAIDRLKGIQTSVALISTSDTRWKKADAVGLTIELVPEKIDSEVILRLLKNGKPYAGAEVGIMPEGKKHRILGNSDNKGKLVFKLPRKFTGELLFTAKVTIATPEKVEYKREHFFTTLYIDLR